jgi:general L-amino acid transport system permease protein
VNTVLKKDLPAELEASGHLGLREDIVGAALPDESVFVRPHKEPTTPREWVKENLFSTPFSGALTVVFGAFGLFLAYKAVELVFFTGRWGVVENTARAYMIGRFPLEEVWRLWVSLYTVVVLAGASFGVSGKRINWTRARIAVSILIGSFVTFVLAYVVSTVKLWLLILALPALLLATIRLGRRIGRNRLYRPLLVAWILLFPAVMILIRGFGGVPPRLWGGFMLNITVAVVAITLSFPIGMLLALGRRSTLPVVRYFSIAVIELVRGNPLFILLTAGSFVLPLLLPPGMSSIPLIIRAMAIYVLFSSAYVAEIVRGGLQGLHHGQYEASRALGLSTTRMMAFVILPQALRATIPAMISHFISVFKDTSLLAVIGGFTDVLKTGRRASAGLGQAGASLEALIPALLLFFTVAFSMSRWSQRLEKRLGVGER